MNRTEEQESACQEIQSDTRGTLFHEEDDPFDEIEEQLYQAHHREEQSSRHEQVTEFGRDLSRSIPVHFIPRELAQRLVEALQERLLLLQDNEVPTHKVKVGPGGFLYWDEMPQAHVVDSIHRSLQQALEFFEATTMLGRLLRHELKVKGSLRIQEAQQNDIPIHSIRYENFLPTWDNKGIPDLVPTAPRPTTPGPPDAVEQQGAAVNASQTPEQQSMPFASNRGPFFNVDDFSITESSSSDESEDDSGSDVFDSNNSIRARPAPGEVNIIHDVEMVGCEGGAQTVDLEVYLAPHDNEEEENGHYLFAEDIEMAVDREAFSAVHGTEGVVDVEIQNEDGALVHVKFADQDPGEGVAADGEAPSQRAEPLPLFPQVTGRLLK